MLTRLVYNFLRQRPGALDALIEELRRRPNYFRKVGPRDYAAAFGGIRVCDDIYGHEVKLGWKPFAELLDCRPAYYGGKPGRRRTLVPSDTGLRTGDDL